MRIYYITFACAASTHSPAPPAAADDFFGFAQLREALCQKAHIRCASASSLAQKSPTPLPVASSISKICLLKGLCFA